MEETKICTNCHKVKSKKEFQKRKYYSRKKNVAPIDKGQTASWCLQCCREYYNKKYKAEWHIKSKDRYKEYREKFLFMYGGKCECCSETIQEFLTLEHKFGQIGIRNKDSSTKAYRKAIKEYRPDLYSVLCHNCNHTIGRLGYCPHHPERKSAYVPLHQG